METKTIADIKEAEDGIKHDPYFEADKKTFKSTLCYRYYP